MSRFLCIDTSTNMCSVALFEEEALLAVKEVNDYHSHTAFLTTYISECVQYAGLQLSDIDAIAIASGPGSYTGLRVGASVVKGLCIGLNLPLIGIRSLSPLVHASRSDDSSGELVAGAIDARRLEVFMRIVHSNGKVIIEDQAVILDDCQAVLDAIGDQKIRVSGDGAHKVREAWGAGRVEVISPIASARNMINEVLQRFESKDFNNLITFSPFYLKNPNITLSKKNVLK